MSKVFNCVDGISGLKPERCQALVSGRRKPQFVVFRGSREAVVLGAQSLNKVIRHYGFPSEVCLP